MLFGKNSQNKLYCLKNRTITLDRAIEDGILIRVKNILSNQDGQNKRAICLYKQIVRFICRCNSSTKTN